MKLLLLLLLSLPTFSQTTTSSPFKIGACRAFTGPGSPEGVVTAVVCDLYFRTDGGSGTTLYIKESGTGNTGWAPAGSGGGDKLGVYVTIATTTATLAAMNCVSGDVSTAVIAQSAVISAGSGTAFVYCYDGLRYVGHNGLTIVCTGCTAVGSVTAPPTGSTPIATLTAVSGVWTAVVSTYGIGGPRFVDTATVTWTKDAAGNFSASSAAGSTVTKVRVPVPIMSLVRRNDDVMGMSCETTSGLDATMDMGIPLSMQFSSSGTPIMECVIQVPIGWDGGVVSIYLMAGSSSPSGGTAARLQVATDCIANGAVLNSPTYGSNTNFDFSGVDTTFKQVRSSNTSYTLDAGCSEGAYLWVRIQRDNTVGSNATTGLNLVSAVMYPLINLIP